jgi:sulfur-carrier protein adenylyltransferase/sulfurtransferase
MNLTNEEIRRYSRHLILPEVGMAGQEKLKSSRVLLVGSGGLGSPLAMYLAAAGVGTLGMVDFDVVDFSNLQRQIVHFTKDVGRPKIVSAQEKVEQINPEVTFIPYETRFTSENAMEISRDYDLIIDGTDNFPTRYLVNDVCVLLKKPNVYGSIFRFEGRVSVFDAEKGPCYRCHFPEPPPPGMVPSCAEGGVLGVLPGIIGLLQASEALKLLLGKGKPLIGRMILFDALEARFREVKVQKDPNCPICGTNPTIKELIDYQHFCGIEDPDSDELAVGSPVRPLTKDEISVDELKSRLDKKEDLFLLDVRNPDEYTICRIGESPRLIPLYELGQRYDEIPKDKAVVAYCHHGVRSIRAAQLLNKRGFSAVKSLHGGINLWSEKIDPGVPRY